MSEMIQGTPRAFGIAIIITLFCLGMACGKKESTEEKPQTSEAKEAQKAQMVQAYGKLPLTFTENRGQVAEPVRFYIRGSRGTVYYTPEEVVYDVVEKTREERERSPHEDRMEASRPDTTVRRKGVVVRMKLEGASPSVVLEGVDEQEGKVNIFRGKDRSQWKTGIRTFGGIVYRDLYPGIDLSYHGRGGRLAPQLTVKPGAKPETIAFRYEGAEKIRIDGQGRLCIETALGTITDPKPFCYQEKKGQRIEIEGSYQMLAENTVGFEVGKHDKKQLLFISIGAQ